MPVLLIIEDEAVLRVSLTRGLSKLAGVEVVDARDLTEALAIIDADPPDLILSDIDLPGRSGLELMQEVARRGLTTTIVYMSGHTQIYGSRLPTDAKVQVIEKPLSIKFLRSLVKEKLGSAALLPNEHPSLRPTTCSSRAWATTASTSRSRFPTAAEGTS